MVMLDTDHMSLLQRGGAEGRNIRQRLRSVPLDDIATSIVSYEEQMRGWLARLARATTLDRQISDYSELKHLLQRYCNITTLDFDAKATIEFERLRAQRIRIGTLDLKIAAIALSNNATPLTRNRSDFSKVANLRTEDWSA